MKTKLLIVLMLALVAAGCSSGSSNDAASTKTNTAETAATATTETESAKNVIIRIFDDKVEILEAFNSLKKEYEQSHPGVKLEIENQAAGQQYNTTLKVKFTSGEMPDIFSLQPYGSMSLWTEELEDLSGESWMNDVLEWAKPGMTFDGKIYGFPASVLGTGYIYNKDLFAKAGISKVPVTLMELTDAVNKLQAAGIKPFIVPYGDWFNPGVFSADNAMSKQANSDQFIQELNAGTSRFSENLIFKDWLKAVQLEVDNAFTNPLTVDFNGQITAMASGQGAMTTSCNCAQLLIDQVTPDLNLGIMPMPINDDAELNDKLLIQVSQYWVLNTNSQVKAEAKEFLKWLGTDGSKYLTDEFKFVPAFKSMKVDETQIGPLGADVKKYIDENKVLAATATKWPEGMMMDFGSTLQKLAGKKIDAEQALSEFQASWDKLKK